MTTANDRDLDLQPDTLQPEDLISADEALLEASIAPDSGDLPQAITESYGTGVHDQPNDLGGRSLRDRLSDYNEASVVLTGGDLDATFEEADAVGDESVGGTAPTPDMDNVDELGAAVGLEMDDQAFLRTSEILAGRDDRRWELEPKSSEDYADRVATEAEEALD